MAVDINGSFRKIVFPTDISYGAVSSTQFSTNKTITQSGYEQVILNWKTFLKNYDVTHTVKTEEQSAKLNALFNQMYGSTYSFLFKDPVDYKISIYEGVFDKEKNDGKGLKQVQLYKKYSYSDDYEAYYRLIKNVEIDKSIVDDFEFTIVDNTNQIVSSDLYELDDFNSGIVTFKRNDNNSKLINTFSSITIGTSNYTKVNSLSSFESLNLKVNDYICLEDEDFSNSTNNLNLKTFKVLQIIDNNNIVIDLTFSDNNVKTNYISKYSTTSKLKFQAEFYVEVRFSEDTASITADDYNSYSFPCSLSEKR